MNKAFFISFYSFERFKITINPFFWIIIIGAILTGQIVEIITLFAVVIIHEIGHLFTANSYQWKIIEIQLLPFGGMAKVEQITDSIWEEFIVAISGPFQNLMMIIIAITFQKMNLWSKEWTTFFINANVLVGVFNLLPISPLDGSKILKVFFYRYFPFRKALIYSIFISIVLSILFLLLVSGIILGTKININGLILAIFFIYNNLQDFKQVPYLFWNFLIQKLKIKPRRNIQALPIIVHRDTPLIEALQLLRKEKYHLYYLLSDDGEIINVIPEEKLLENIFDNKELYRPIYQIVG
ncbi:hypothetical protein BHF71_03180 [Vulcanibacillus modesticaldus]|uniref:CBS domain-containing protein n=1 Tax=Vulcanibacillus modesticaldus TaxID=337097 RepID=A0A1D2YSR6_9BACI|nr:site-2 protease family protein [Vulcanibacillus modesticaldus]OEF98038.1 hypothetical protein BHF71_03180 [Vulcanibacillus modesticaldus]